MSAAPSPVPERAKSAPQEPVVEREAPAPERGPTPGDAPPEPKRASGRKPILLALLAVALVIGAIWGYRFWSFASTHESTDDAQLTSDIVQIAPQVSGTVTQVLVNENQEVKKGDLIATLDPSTYQAAYDQAKANLDANIAAARQAGVSVSLTSQTGNAQELQAEGVVSQADSGIAQANADVARTNAGIYSALAANKSAQANVVTAQGALNVAIANKKRAQDAVSAAQAQVATAKAAVSAQQAAVDAAQAVYDRAEQDSQRYATLLQEGAASAQTADTAAATARQAKAQLESAKQQVAQAQAGVLQQQANVSAAQQQVNADTAAIAQAQSQLAAAKEQVGATQAGIKEAQAMNLAAKQSVDQARARREQALGQLKQANTAPTQVAVSKGSQAQALAKIEQAKAALENAQIQLGYTKIYAPVDGRVSKKTVEVGALVQPGTALLAIVPDRDIWVEANFKETQLANVKAGSPAEVEVDGLPAHPFHGHVDSISAGTGATFALLPPDNATGNFTKVVQRIPVKIVLDPGQPDYGRLRAGMSVTAIITTK